MSQTYSIACKDCREHLWIGQGRTNQPVQIYSDHCHINALGEFLKNHAEHHLIFGNNCNEPILDFTGIEIRR